MTDDHDAAERAFAERFQRAYRATPDADPGAARRVVAAVRGTATPRRRGLAAWLAPHPVTLRPVVAVAAAVALVAAGVLLGRVTGTTSARAPIEVATAAVPTESVRFVLVVPAAHSVALVGDFNGWDAGATPMRRDGGVGAWTVTVPITAGWHAYAFVVDGARWVHDPGAPLAPADGFGGPRSVIVVGDHGV